ARQARLERKLEAAREHRSGRHVLSLEAGLGEGGRLVDRAVQVQGVVRKVGIDLSRLSLRGRADRARRRRGGGEPNGDYPAQIVGADAFGREHGREDRDLVDRTLERVEALTEATDERGAAATLQRTLGQSA